MCSYGQLVTDHYPHESQLVDVITGKGVRTSNITFRGALESRGVFKNENTPLILEEGIILSTGEVKAAMGPNKGEGFTGLNNTMGDKDLFELAQSKTFDAAVLQFDFVPKKEVLRFYFVFGSDEYLEYVNSGFNDVFGFFIKDLYTQEQTNIGIIPGTNEPITINNINFEKNKDFFISNTVRSNRSKNSHTIEYDGLTKRLVAYHQVIPGRKYQIKIAIADAGDDNYDSAVFIEGGSFSSQSKEDFISENKIIIDKFLSDTDTLAILNPEPEIIEDTTTSIEEVEEKTINIESVTIHFDFDQHHLSNAEQNKLKTWVKNLDTRKSEDLKFSIVGHTDQKGSKAYNQKLSDKRAQFVKQKLIELGYSKSTFVTEGKSFTEPLTPGTNEADRALNRRVSIQVIPNNQ